MLIEGKIRLEKKCSFDSVWGCPVLERRMCKQASQMGKTKLIDEQQVIEGEYDKARFNSYDRGRLMVEAIAILESLASHKLDREPDVWGTCLNLEDLELILGMRPDPTLSFGNEIAVEVQVDGVELMKR